MPISYTKSERCELFRANYQGSFVNAIFRGALKITQALLDSLPFQNSGTFWVNVAEHAGFNHAVGKITKTFCASARPPDLEHTAVAGQFWNRHA